jgi:RNA polymerase sigma-70 factor (ECF subfamily)
MAACATAPQLTSRPHLTAIHDLKPLFNPTITTDDALVESAKLGNADAFAKLMERYHRFCLSKAYAILRNRGDAEDEVQNAWVQAWTHLGSYEVQGAFCSWLGRIVSNQCLMRLRKKKFRLDLIDQRALPEDIVGDDEVALVLTKEIRGVPPVLREVLVMRDVTEVAMGDIASKLGISIPAVKSRLMRARLELRRRLTKHHGENGGGTLLQKSARRRMAYMQAT